MVNQTFDRPSLSLPLGALLIAIVMRLAERLHVRGIEPQSIVSTMGNDVIADRSHRLSYTALGTGDDDLGRRQSSQPEIAQAEHAMWMLGEVLRAYPLPVSTVAARRATLLSRSPRRGLNDLSARFQWRKSRSECSQSRHERKRPRPPKRCGLTPQGDEETRTRNEKAREVFTITGFGGTDSAFRK